MKKRMRMLPLLLAFALLLTACGKAAAVKDNVPVEEIAAEVLEELSARGDLTRMNDSYVNGIMGMDTANFSEYAIYVSAVGTNIDEFGVFKTSPDLKSDEAAEQIRAYLQMREDTWMNQYTPEEHPKLEKAEVKVLGNYVMYVILSDTERKAALAAFADELTD